MSQPEIVDVVEIHTAAKFIRANVFADGQRIGTEPNGWPVYAANGVVRVDMRPGRRYQ